MDFLRRVYGFRCSSPAGIDLSCGRDSLAPQQCLRTGRGLHHRSCLELNRDLRAKYTLKSDAQVKLAKVSGILLAYPNLKVQVEGYTDNIGTDEYSQKLSEQRADAVREFLVAQSVADANITAQGYGKSDPIADNSSNSGRAQNRRVELVVSGAAIGVEGSQANEQNRAAQSQATPRAKPQR
jgi:hypothetical protein